MSVFHKQLLTVDLCGRLPYGVKIMRPDGRTMLDLVGINEGFLVFNEMRDSEKVQTQGVISPMNKPVLFPISYLTKEITLKDYNSGKPFIPIVELVKLAEPYYFVKETLKINEGFNVLSGENDEKVISYGCSFVSKDNVAFAFFYMVKHNSFVLANEINERLYINDMGGLFELMNIFHIDYRGLIDSGLAFDASLLETNPYA